MRAKSAWRLVLAACLVLLVGPALAASPVTVLVRDALAAAEPPPEERCRAVAARRPLMPSGEASPSGDYLGTWVIQPYVTNAGGRCGQIKYSGWMVIDERVTANHFRGRNYFNWDLSRLSPGCSVDMPANGKGPVDIFVNGDQVTIKYGSAGGMRFSDDHLIRAGATLRGQDNAGNTIIYTLKPRAK